VCTVGGMCAGGRATCGGGDRGHVTYVLEAVEVVFHVVEVVDDMGRVLEVEKGLGRLLDVVGRCLQTLCLDHQHRASSIYDYHFD